MDVSGTLMLTVGLLGSIATALNSPCPDLFHYDSTDQPGQWTGTLTLLSDAELHGVWIRLIFDGKLTELDVDDDFGEVVSSFNETESYLIKNRNFLLKSATPTNVKITVKYEGNKAPNLIGYRLNAKMVCLAQNLDSVFLGDLDNKAFLSSVLSGRKDYDEFEGCGTVPLLEQKNEKVGKGQWPWQAAIYIQKNGENLYTCGATLISPKHVLTAAHCVSSLKSRSALPPHLFTVYLNRPSLEEAGNEQKSVAERIFVHPGYSPANLRSDLAVIQLAKPVIINDYVRPICLRNSPDENEGFLVGYGINGERKIEDLAQAEVEIINEEECSEHPNLKSLLTDNVLCARYVDENPLCVGDSGSGLASSRDGPNAVWFLRGVVSIGVALQDKNLCDHSARIFVVDVAKYLKWIQEVTL